MTFFYQIVTLQHNVHDVGYFTSRRCLGVELSSRVADRVLIPVKSSVLLLFGDVLGRIICVITDLIINYSSTGEGDVSSRVCLSVHGRRVPSHDALGQAGRTGSRARYVLECQWKAVL